ncbi:MAG TPA: carboxypeptidase regulatory-like domain-containing protein [Candidatus Acidoferrales bacterium]|nr:carboxypeptidase regulatory-like domain-containing protein [Candidatus Acidoferrales bacterium]
MRQMIRGFLATAAMCALLAVTARTQTVTATLTGRVLDANGAAIPGATVTATNRGTGFSRSTTTSGEGEYLISALPAGNYTVTATAKGFKKEAAQATLQVGQAATLNLTLAVGETTQQVTVEATTEVTEPTRTQISTVIQERQIESLPVNGREFIDFALLSPAVQIGDTTSGSTDVIVEPVTKLSFAGQNIHFNFIAVDGADDISTVSGIQRGTPPQDSVQEFRVINTNFTTDFGRAVGGIVNIITKSGTNTMHGSLYEYFRNDVLDAKSILSAPGLNTLRQNQFGLAVGGPIQKDRTFYFVNYEGQRHGESPFYNSVILANIGDSVNPAPGTINFVKKNVFGLPTEPAGLNVLRTADTNNGFARLDHNFSDKETFMARYFVNQGTFLNQSPLNDGFDLPSGFKNNRINDQSLVGSLTSVLTPNVINQLRVQYARRSFDFKTATTQPHLEVANTFAVGVNRGNPDYYLENRGEVDDDVTINFGKNTFSFGGDFNYVVSTESFPLFYPFEADFGSLQAFLGTDGAVTGCGLATCPDPFVIFFERFQSPTFTEPTLANFSQIYTGGAIPNAIRNQAEGTIHHTYNGLYVQNKWRATNRLTMNYGLRWEFETWPSRALNNQYNNFDPRLGIAYRLGGGWNFTLRAGAGLFHGIIPSPLLGCQIPSCGGQTLFPGHSELDSLNSKTELFAYAGGGADTNAALLALLASGTYPDAAPVPGYVFTNGGSAGPNCFNPMAASLTQCFDAFFGPATVVRFDKNHRNPYGIQSSLSLDFEPAKDTTVSISFLRVKGVHLGSFYNINQPIPTGQDMLHDSAGNSGLKNTFFLPSFFGVPPHTVPGTACELNGISCPENYAIYFEATSRWNSLFNGLLVNVNKRFSNHFSAEISYTFSHTIDDGPNPSFVLIPQDSGNFGAEKANSADDVRHRFVFNGVLASPTTGNLWWRDYQLSTIVTLQSPEFFTKFAGFDANGDIFGNNDRVGIEGRDTFRGTNLYTVDLRGTRTFTFHEKQKLQFSAEAFNLLNHVNVKYFNTVYGAADFCDLNPVPASCGAGPFFFQGSPNPNYGTPRAVFNPRQIQLVLRYSW